MFYTLEMCEIIKGQITQNPLSLEGKGVTSYYSHGGAWVGFGYYSQSQTVAYIFRRKERKDEKDQLNYKRNTLIIMG